MNQVAAAPLVVQELSLSFGGNHVLKNISMVLQPGRITGLIGPNGAGKTSFFNCLTGLYTAQGGQILLGHESVKHMPPAERAARGFSRSFQHVALCPELSVVENVMVAFNRHAKAGWLQAFLPWGKGREERTQQRRLALAALEELGVGEVANASPAELAPGILRLVEIARAIAGKPKVLLLDEPAAGLNSVETRELAKALINLRAPDLVLVVVEHDMDLIMDVCDDIHVLNVGTLLASGAPATIQTHPDVVRVYLGEDDDEH